MSEREPVVVAVDFTADRLRIMLATLGGEPLFREEFALPALDDEAAWAWEVGGRISTAFAAEGNRRSALGIAVACPGTVDTAAGRILESTGQPAWDGLSVVEALRRHIDAPIVAINRTHAALRGETAAGAAEGLSNVLYVSLRGTPSAATLVSGRVAAGSGHRAGALPALPEIPSVAPLDDETVERVVTLLADAAALLDPEAIVIDAAEPHASAVIPVLQEVIEEVSPGPRVVPAALGESAALIGAMQAAAIVAYEGERGA